MDRIFPARNQPVLPFKPPKELLNQRTERQKVAKMLFLVSFLFLTCLFTVPQGSDASYSFALLDYPGADTTTIMGISDGNIVGWYSDSSGIHGFKYDGTTWTSLDFPGTTTGTEAYGISGDNIVGWYIDDSGIHGFKYDGATWTSLDFPGASVTSAFGVDGSNIVGRYYNDSGQHGFKFDGTTWTSLDYPGASNEFTYSSGTWAKGISDGNIVGSYSDGYSTYGFQYDGTTWTTPGPPVITPAHFINGIDGDNIVGWYGNQGFIFNGTTWTSLYYPGASWTQANGINGCYIVGSHGDSYGYSHGFLAAQEFLLSIIKSGSGNGDVLPSGAINWSGNIGTTAYPCDTVATLTALAANDSIFTNWTGCDVADGNNQCTVTMSNNRTVSAAFTLKPTLAITLSGTGIGSINSAPIGINCGSICSAPFDRGTVVTLMPIPEEGSLFTGWSGGGCAGYGTCIMTLNADSVINAELTAIQAGNPKISVTPAAINFGSLKSGSASTQKVITIQNTGKGSLIIDSIAVSGPNANAFVQTNSCHIIHPNSSCKINVTFSSTSPFGKKSAILSVSSNTPKKPTVNVRLLGKTEPPKIAVSPKSISFDPQEIGSSSLPKIITIKNTGMSDVMIDNITITGLNGGEFSQTNFCSTIPKDSSCIVSVTFVPDFPASKKSAMLRISSNDPKKAIINVKLSGKGE